VRVWECEKRTTDYDFLPSIYDARSASRHISEYKPSSVFNNANCRLSPGANYDEPACSGACFW